jgi:hypothetical protein
LANIEKLYGEVQCATCERKFILYKAYRKLKGKYLPISYTPRCPNCQTVYITKPTQSSLKPKNLMKKTKKIKSQLKPRKAFRSKVKKAKKTSVLTPPKTKRTKNTLAYYQCLCQQTQFGLKGKKITQACSECKHSAPALGVQRKKEVQKLVGAYRQLGVSLSKILNH